MTEPITLLTRCAQTHHGLFRLRDAESCGVTEPVVRSLVDRCWCDRPVRGVYRVRGAPETQHQLLLSAVWGCGPDAVVSHRAAARLFGLPWFGHAPPEVTRPFGQKQPRAWGRLHVSKRLPHFHVTEIDRIPTTTPARTMFDLAGVVPPALTERVLDAALQRRICTVAQVQSVFFALARRGRRGTVTMRRLLEERGAGYVPPASELEHRARRLFERAGIARPDYEVDLGDADWIGRVDCVWREQRVVVELDGRRYHDGLLARTADRERDNRLMAAGWRVIRVTWDDLAERPDVVVGWIRAALADAA